MYQIVEYYASKICWITNIINGSVWHWSFQSKSLVDEVTTHTNLKMTKSVSKNYLNILDFTRFFSSNSRWKDPSHFKCYQTKEAIILPSES